MEQLNKILALLEGQKVTLVHGDVCLEGTLHSVNLGLWRVTNDNGVLTTDFKLTDKSDMFVHADGFIQINL